MSGTWNTSRYPLNTRCIFTDGKYCLIGAVIEDEELDVRWIQPEGVGGDLMETDFHPDNIIAWMIAPVPYQP